MPAVRHSAEQRAEALRLYAEVGPSEASRQTGIKRVTISAWARRDGVQPVADILPHSLQRGIQIAKLSREQRVARLSDGLLEVAEVHTDLVRAGEVRTARDLVAMLQVVHSAVTDSQLLAGHATARIESTDPEQVRAEIAEMQAAWRQRQSV